MLEMLAASMLAEADGLFSGLSLIVLVIIVGLVIWFFVSRR